MTVRGRILCLAVLALASPARGQDSPGARFIRDLAALETDAAAVKRHLAHPERDRARARRDEAGSAELARDLRAVEADKGVLYPIFADNERANRDAVAAGYMSRFVPYIEQHEPRDADLSYNGHYHCGKTTMAMIARAFGFRPDLKEDGLVNFFGEAAHAPPTKGFGHGLRPWRRMAEAAGLRVAMKGPGADTAWIAERLKAGDLVAALGTYAAMPPHRDLSRVPLAKTGHYIAVVGLDDHGDFLVNDPADPSAKRISAAELAAFIDAIPGQAKRQTPGFQYALGPAAR